MNWVDFKFRQPIDGQKVLVYTKDHEIFYCSYNDKDHLGEIPWLYIVHKCTGCSDNLVNKDTIIYWASPQPPEIE